MVGRILYKLSFVCLFLLAIGCKKEPTIQNPPHQPHPYWGTVSAQRNGADWQANIFSSYYPLSNTFDKFGLTADVFAKTGDDSLKRESLGILNIDKRAYLSDLDSAIYDTSKALLYANTSVFATYYRYYEDGDVISMPYRIALNEPHWIQVTSFDEETKETSGRFSITFISWGYQDTIRFTNGSFHTKVQVP